MDNNNDNCYWNNNIITFESQVSVIKSYKTEEQKFLENEMWGVYTISISYFISASITALCMLKQSLYIYCDRFSIKGLRDDFVM